MVKDYEGLLYYKVVKKISMNHMIPESTVRWNLNKLRDAKLIVSGNIEQKGVPVKLTSSGRMIASLFANLDSRSKEAEIRSTIDQIVTIEP